MITITIPSLSLLSGGGQRAEDGGRVLLQHLRRQEGADGGGLLPDREEPVDGGHHRDRAGGHLGITSLR